MLKFSENLHVIKRRGEWRRVDKCLPKEYIIGRQLPTKHDWKKNALWMERKKYGQIIRSGMEGNVFVVG